MLRLLVPEQGLLAPEQGFPMHEQGFLVAVIAQRFRLR
jgi:hypothetical protein